MCKMDSNHQITVSKDMMLKASIDFNAHLRLYVKGRHLFLDTPSPTNYSLPCIGEIKLNSYRRFTVPQMVRTIFNFNPGDEIEFYIYDGKLAFKRVFRKKE